MRLKFTIDKKYDSDMAKAFGFPKEVLEEMNKKYKDCLPFLENSRKLYQKSWNEIGKNFSDYIEKKTGYKWFYPKYECVVSIIHGGISNW